MVQASIDANIEPEVMLGQLYVERPGDRAPLDMSEFNRACIALGVRELTVVDLRSTGGSERMCQEFYGAMSDPERIHYRVAHRLGPELPNWRMIQAHVLRLQEPG